MRAPLFSFLLSAAAACGSSSDKSDDTASLSDCGFAIPARFISVEEQQTGLGADGDVVMDHWTLSFEETTFAWGFSDAVENGQYTCDGSEITGQVSWGPISGSYDAPSHQLVWDGLDYKMDHAG